MKPTSSMASPFRTATLAFALFAAPGLAVAGMCPADKLGTDATPASTAAAKGVKDVVLSMIDLSKEPANVQGRLLRIRQLEIEPGGIVPWHSHGNRPALIYMVKGEMVEHASNCAVPIVHKAGDVARETHVTSHWWENKTRETVVLISADLPPSPDHKGM